MTLARETPALKSILAQTVDTFVPTSFSLFGTHYLKKTALIFIFHLCSIYNFTYSPLSISVNTTLLPAEALLTDSNAALHQYILGRVA